MDTFEIFPWCNANKLFNDVHLWLSLDWNLSLDIQFYEDDSVNPNSKGYSSMLQICKNTDLFYHQEPI